MPSPRAITSESAWEEPYPYSFEEDPAAHPARLWLQDAASTPEAYAARARKRHPQIFIRSRDETASAFSALAAEWRANTLIESNLHRIVLDSAYQRIIGLGPVALPHILRDLQETRAQWFWALAAIVGEDKAAGSSTHEEAVEAWLSWARSAGLADG